MHHQPFEACTTKVGMEYLDCIWSSDQQRWKAQGLQEWSYPQSLQVHGEFHLKLLGAFIASKDWWANWCSIVTLVNPKSMNDISIPLYLQYCWCSSLIGMSCIDICLSHHQSILEHQPQEGGEDHEWTLKCKE